MFLLARGVLLCQTGPVRQARIPTATTKLKTRRQHVGNWQHAAWLQACRILERPQLGKTNRRAIADGARDDGALGSLNTPSEAIVSATGLPGL